MAEHPAEPHIEVEDLVVHYGDVMAVMRISRRVCLGDFVQYLVEWAGDQLVVRRPPTEDFDEGEQVYLGIALEHCVLLES